MNINFLNNDYLHKNSTRNVFVFKTPCKFCLYRNSCIKFYMLIFFKQNGF